MGRLAKLKQKAIKSANEDILEREKRELRARKERDNAKTAQNATKDDLFNIVGINRAKSKPGITQYLNESTEIIKEKKDAEWSKKNPYIHIEVAADDLSEKSNKDIHRDMTQLFNFKKWMRDPLEYKGKDEGKGVVSRDAEGTANLIVSGFPDGNKNIWVAHYSIGKNSGGINDMMEQLQQDFKEYGNENEIEDFSPSLSKFWGKKWWEKEEMNEALRQMKYLVDYDTSKTREENQSINELHLLDPEGWDDDFKKAQEKRKDGPNYKWNVPPYEKASKEELRKALHAKQRAAVGLDPEEPTFSMPVVDVSGTDRGAAQDKGITFGDSGMDINIDSIEIEDIDRDDYPRFSDAYASYAEWEDGTELTDDELDELTDNQPDLINRLALETLQGE
jgi:hypothetical protein